MDLAELRSLRPALDRFARKFDDCIKTRPSRAHLRTYLNGQLGPLERKSIEPIALNANVSPRTLQEFFSIHRWDERSVGKRHRSLVARDHGDDNAIGVIDETSFAKKGKKTAGVQRQHCGSTGKTDNCVVTVHLGYVANDFHALLDGDLYLPEETWSKDRKRCREAGIPDDVVYRPKWKIALELLQRSRHEGVPMRWVTADEVYGRVREFRRTVAGLGLTYVAEIPASITGWTKPHRAGDATKARPVSKLWLRGGPTWTKYQIKQTDKGPVVWEVRETRFFPRNDGDQGEEERLLIVREVLTGEVKYFLANVSAEVPLKTLLFVAFSRWHIERLFEDGKGEVGFDHFEVRCYRSLMRHLVLTTLSLYFLCEQTQRLRGGKSELDPSPGEDGTGGAAGQGDAAA